MGRRGLRFADGHAARARARARVRVRFRAGLAAEIISVCGAGRPAADLPSINRR